MNAPTSLMPHPDIVERARQLRGRSAEERAKAMQQDPADWASANEHDAMCTFYGDVIATIETQTKALGEMQRELANRVRVELIKTETTSRHEPTIL